MAEEPLLGSSSNAEVGNAYKFPAKSVFLTFVIVIIVALIVSFAIFFIVKPPPPTPPGDVGQVGTGDHKVDNAGQAGDTTVKFPPIYYGEKTLKDYEKAGDNVGQAGDTTGYGGDIPDCGTSMTAKERKTLLEEHNKYRSQVAKGEYTIKSPKGKFRSLPPATRMYKLKYNCSLEKSAVNWAIKTKCTMTHTKGENYGENLYKAWGDTRSDRRDQAAAGAPYGWSQEISKHGISALNEWTFQIGHATQVFSARTKWIGCGIHTCVNNVSLVCHYYPRGNIRPYNHYAPGKTLSECGKNASNERPDESTGLCLWS